MPTWLDHEPRIRLGIFAALFLLFALLEWLLPRRKLTAHKTPRWLSHAALFAINVLVVRLLVPLSVVSLGAYVETSRLGLVQWLKMPDGARVVLAVLLLDVAIYGQHVLFHRVPLLWRLHRVHHADLDIDVTTGLRFHLLEILLSLAIKAVVILLIGAPALAVLIFEILLNAGSMFSHSNWRLPRGVDRALRFLIVTPDMHRVHHSVIPTETNSNFGFHLSWWDWLFRTYQDQPSAGHEGMTIGLSEYRDEQQADRLPGMLLLPWQMGRADNSLQQRETDT